MKAIFLCVGVFLCLNNSLFAQSISEYIVVDQFGYRPNDDKIAIIRNPSVGNDSNESFTPGSQYALVNEMNSTQVYLGGLDIWNNGAVDVGSGDKVWWFDFSSFTTEGSYYILDIANNVKSFSFDIREDVYDDAFKHAFRYFFYQRSGYPKALPYAETGWTDEASHLGVLQDKACRYHLSPNDESTEKDVHGGWYDAGDFNKYTTWTAAYIDQMLIAFEERPGVWTDDFGIPESNNGIPDILDEAKWGLDHLLRLQFDDGGFTALVDAAHASPPSSGTAQSLYGEKTTGATLRACAALAHASTIFKIAGNECYADTLLTASLNAWAWADTNPNEVWNNQGTGIGAGEQEVDDYGRLMFKLDASMRLFEATGESIYQDFFDANYLSNHMMEWYFVYPYEHYQQEVLLNYTTLPGATPSVINTIKSRFETGMNGDNNFVAYADKTNGYNAYIGTHTWGSNNVHSMQGLQFHEFIKYNIDPTKNNSALNAALGHINYIHGVNPLAQCYLTNMEVYGAEQSSTQLYHTWFSYNSTLWDEVGVSQYGPPPGFLVGGANEQYSLDNCCATSCGGAANDNLCNNSEAQAIIGQPAMKSFANINDNWPVNSWEVTENSNGYQISYLRLLAQFIEPRGSETIAKVYSNCDESQVTCDDASVVLATNGVSSLDTCRQGEWTHYLDENNLDNIIFSIKKNGNEVQCIPTITVSPTMYSSEVASQEATYVMNRNWSVECQGSDYVDGMLSVPVDVRFYFNQTEKDAIETAATDFQALYPTLIKGPLYWFKSDDGVNYDIVSNLTAQGVDSTYKLDDFSYGEADGTLYVQLNEVSGFSGGSAGVYVGGSVVLPVSFDSFKATKENGENLITWEVSDESEESVYCLKYSPDGKNYLTISKHKAGQGNYVTSLSSLYTDGYLQVVEVKEGIDIASSSILALKSDDEDWLEYTNPLTQSTDVIYHSNQNKELEFQIINALGEKIYTGIISSNTKIECPPLLEGVYFFQFIQDFQAKVYKISAYN